MSVGKSAPVRWRPLLARRLVVLTAALAGSAVLARVADRHWVFELFSHFTRHYFLGGLLLAGLLLWLGRPRWALLAGLLAASQLPFLEGYAGSAEQPCRGTRETEELRLLQFNIGRSNRKAPARYSWLKGRRPPPDILILLEATGRLEPTLDDLRLEGFTQQLAAFREDNYGIAVASRLADVEISLETMGDPNLPAILVRGRTRAESIAFTLVAAHPPPPLGAELAAARNRQLAALAEFMNRQPGPNRILVGDLNVTPWSPWFRRLLDGAGLRNAQFGQGHLGTFPAFGLPSILALPIDHTLVSPDVRVLARSVGPGLPLGSDHRPVATVLQLGRCE